LKKGGEKKEITPYPPFGEKKEITPLLPPLSKGRVGVGLNQKTLPLLFLLIKVYIA